MKIKIEFEATELPDTPCRAMAYAFGKYHCCSAQTFEEAEKRLIETLRLLAVAVAFVPESKEVEL